MTVKRQTAPKISERQARAKRKQTILHRLYLDGFVELQKAETSKEKAFWCIVIIGLYCSAIGLIIQVISRYHIGRRIVSIENIMPRETLQYLPQLTICHTANWNKTFLEQNVQIPDQILAKAAKMDIDRAELLAEFSRYISYYSIMYDGEFTLEMWELLTELFEYNFRDVQFADFVSDAAFRGKEIFSQCQFSASSVQYGFPCQPIQMALDMPACYFLPIATPTDPLYPYGITTDKYDNPSLSFKISIQNQHIFNRSHETTASRNSGVRLILGGAAPPLANQLYVPANTHALVTFEHVFRLKRPAQTWKPLSIFQSTPYGYEICVVEVLENKTMEICGCHFLAGEYYPRNGKVCTPNLIKNCAREYILANGTRAEQLEILRQNCSHTLERVTIASATFNNLYLPVNHSVQNLFTLRQRTDRWLYLSEHDVYDYYQIVSDLGGLAGVYTGLSGAAIAHAVILLGSACLTVINRKLIKPALGRLLDGKVAIAISSGDDRTPAKKIHVKRLIRVSPM